MYRLVAIYLYCCAKKKMSVVYVHNLLAQEDGLFYTKTIELC
jgi:hypothetical protein